MVKPRDEGREKQMSWMRREFLFHFVVILMFVECGRKNNEEDQERPSSHSLLLLRRFWRDQLLTSSSRSSEVQQEERENRRGIENGFVDSKREEMRVGT